MQAKLKRRIHRHIGKWTTAKIKYVSIKEIRGKRRVFTDGEEFGPFDPESCAYIDWYPFDDDDMF